ncbi:hypothetical protein AWB81_00243 [Caballeronia arationis]|uniref:hypothetical protein n=1 Tax=Caballeronia arationis TaxID=1777142 RepID=UPI00074C85FF|nr:hypothetical protein [Caballeronia arationis]SAK43481.1 hypothetical protein AWB81_00243 [Caballeronia arationis]
MHDVEGLRALLLRKKITVFEAARLISGDSGCTQDFVALIVEAIEGSELPAQIVRWSIVDYENGDYDGAVNDMQTTLLRKDLDEWCQGLGIRLQDMPATPIAVAPKPPSAGGGEALNSEAIASAADPSWPEDDSDWRVQARRIADEFFDRDTANDVRDSLKGYSHRVMQEMQKRRIHGPRGRISSAGTVQREALQGTHWWAKKEKT